MGAGEDGFQDVQVKRRPRGTGQPLIDCNARLCSYLVTLGKQVHREGNES